VNVTAQSNNVDITLRGAAKVGAKAQCIQLKADTPTATNTIDAPRSVVPVKSTVKVGGSFSIALPAYSVTILNIPMI
jgi:alpha-L-arabinofuranosidase